MGSASNGKFSMREPFSSTDAMLAISLTNQDQHLTSRFINGQEEADNLPPLATEQAAQLGLVRASYAGKPSLEALLSDLFHPKAEKRIQAVHGLEPWIQSAHEKVIHGLCYALQDPSEFVRAAAAQLFAEIEHPVPISVLMIALNDPSWMVRASVGIALGSVGKDTPLKDLIRVLKKDTDVSVREAIARILGRKGHRAAIGALVTALHDKEALVREAAAWSLGELQAEVSVKSLLNLLRHDHDVDVQRTAAISLGKLPGTDAREALMQAIDDNDERVCNIAIWAAQQKEEEYHQSSSTDDDIERILDDINLNRGILFPETESLSKDENIWPYEGMLPLWEELDRQHSLQKALLSLKDFIKDKRGYVY